MVSSSGDQESIWWAERAQGVYPAQEVWIDMKMHIVALCVLWVESTLSNFWVLPCSKSCGSIVIRIGQRIYLLITVILHVMSIFIPICCMAMSEVLLVVYIFCQDYPVLNSYFGNEHYVPSHKWHLNGSWTFTGFWDRKPLLKYLGSKLI